jgi:hypothetical protein
VEAQGALQPPLELPNSREVRSPEHHVLQFGENGAQQPLHEAVGPGMPYLDPAALYWHPAAGPVEARLPLRARAREHGPHPVARPAVAREERLAQEARRLLCVGLRRTTCAIS